MKEWTIMVYMAGDNNLSDDMAFSLDELRNFTSSLSNGGSEKISILAYFDSNSLTAPTRFYDFSDADDPVEADVGRDDLHHFSVYRNPSDHDAFEGNAASAYSIMNFVRWCIETRGRTAENYAVIFSGHSFGFHGDSLMRDESSGAYMTIFKFRWALEQICELYLKNQKIGILGFDSCLMSMLEVGYELKNVAQTIVASEGSIPNSGWAYTPMLMRFIRTFFEPRITPLNVKEAAAAFVEGFILQQRKYLIGGRSVDIAAWDLDEVEPVVTAVSKLGEALLDKLNLPRIRRRNGKLSKTDVLEFEQLKNVILQSHISCQTYMSDQCVDLQDFCQRMMIECHSIEKQLMIFKYPANTFRHIRKLCDDVLEALRGCILKSGYCGDTYQYSNGISLYFPWTALAFSQTQYRYQYLRFNRAPKKDSLGPGEAWMNFLFYYLFVATLRKKRTRGDVDFETQFHELVSSDLAKEEWTRRTRDDWRSGTRDNWRLGTRDDWRAGTRDDWRAGTRDDWQSGTRANWRLGTRDDWRSGTKGAIDGPSEAFGRFKNYQLDWELSGFSDEDRVDQTQLSAPYFQLVPDDETAADTDEQK